MGVTENTLVGCDREHFGENDWTDREENRKMIK